MARSAQIKSQLTSKRQQTMLAVDFRRMFRTSRFWIMLMCALVMPILILVMTTSMGGMTVTDPQTGVETTMEAFKSTWQIIAEVAQPKSSMLSEPSAQSADSFAEREAALPTGEGSAMAMDMTSMCNINLMYFLAGILICLFVADDFRSGYAKNLFTVRAKKTDYIVSKTLVGFVGGALFLMAFFIGAALGGGIAGLPFDLGAAGIGGLIMCMLAKISLMAVFAAIAVPVSVFAKQRAWLSVLLYLFGGMLLFMMIPMMSPLNAGVMHVGLCLAGGALFAAGIGAVSGMVLSKTDLI